MRTFSETTKIGWNENKYKKSLNDEEKKVWKSLTREQKDTAVLAFANNEPIDLLNGNIDESEYALSQSDLNANHSLGSYLTKRGITNLTNETAKMLSAPQYKSNFDGFQSGIAKISGNPYQNTIMNTSVGTLDTNLAQIKLMDTMLKNDKRIIEQNEEIIQLLKIIADK